MTALEAYRDLVERALVATIEDADVDALLEGMGVGRYTNDLPDDEAGADATLDCLQAFVELEDDDAAHPWNLGGTLQAAGRHLEAAASYRRAAMLFEVEHVGLEELDADEREWADASVYHAALQYAHGGRPLTAAILSRRIADEEFRAEVVELVRSRARA